MPRSMERLRLALPRMPLLLNAYPTGPPGPFSLRKQWRRGEPILVRLMLDDRELVDLPHLR